MIEFDSHLRSSSYGNDTGEKVSNHRFHRNVEAIHMDRVDETQTVLRRSEKHEYAEMTG